MINGLSVLAVIPARAGSKGVPGKNLRKLAGKPLIEWTIVASRASKYVDRIVLSTDDPETADVAEKAGCEVPFLRPANLAADETSAVEVLLHALNQCPKFDVVVYLQPTSPFRTSEDIDTALEHFTKHTCYSAITVMRLKHPLEWLYFMENGRLNPVIDGPNPSRRQEASELVTPNGAVYVVSTRDFLEQQRFQTVDSIAVEMPYIRSIDIDTLDDFTMAELIAGSEKRIARLC